jgi:ATP-dependent protease ClpP protease subunit
VDSPGGSPFVAQAFYVFLKNHPARKIVVIGSRCYSAATYFLFAADHIIAHSDSYMYLHESQMPMVGGASEYRSAANALENEERFYRRLLSARSGLSAKNLRERMTRGGTGWHLTPQEGLQFHLINEIREETSPKLLSEEKTTSDSPPCIDCPFGPWQK